MNTSPAGLSTCLDDYGDLLAIDEAAAVLRVHPNSIYSRIREGSLGAVRIGRRLTVPKIAIQRMIDDAQGVR